MAGLVIFQLWWGWRTTWIPPGYDKLDAYEVHALVGAVLLILATMRGGWRIIAPFLLPALEEPEDFPGWQKRASQLTHIALYACMFAMPVSGWLMLSLSSPEAGIALPWGWTWPVLPFVQDLAFVERARLEQAAESAHLWIAWFMLGLVVLHVGAALQHQIIKQDEVLARMIPWLSREKPRA
jgi:cytochrome b561